MYVIDFEERDAQGLKDEIKFSLEGIVKIADIREADIGEFEDDHELNQTDATMEQHEKYFR
jgi:CBS domain containing-hemolysin-like protein